MNFKEFFVTKDGWLSNRGSWVLIISGFSMAIVPWFIEPYTKFHFIVFLFGLILLGIDGFEGKTRQYGLHAPFYDYGKWRKIKRDNALKEAEDENKSEVDTGKPNN